MALFDLIFNLGQPDLKHNWPNMNKAIRALDWGAAAAHSSRRPPVAKERNEFVEALKTAAEKAK